MAARRDRANVNLLRRESYYSRRVAQRYVEALDIARGHADLPRATREIRAGNYSAAVDALFPRAAQEELRSALNVAAIQVMMRSAERTMRVDIPAILRTDIGAPTPAIIKALHTLDFDNVAPIVDGSLAAVHSVLNIGLHEGMNPVDVARWARDGIGLSEYDMSLVQSFEALLRGAPRDALARTLRDARFDGTLKAAALGQRSLNEADIVLQRTRYLERLHQWRAVTFTRTTTLDALRQGQLVSWFDAAEGAGVDTEQLVKTWWTTLDGKERPEHHAAHGTTVPMADKFPVDGGVDVPGEGVYNCRCAFTVRLLPAGRDSASRFMRERASMFAAQRNAATFT